LVAQKLYESTWTFGFYFFLTLRFMDGSRLCGRESGSDQV
jgi:hypothetical protein